MPLDKEVFRITRQLTLFLNRRLKMEEKMHSSLYLTTLKKSIVLVNITSQTNKYNVQP